MVEDESLEFKPAVQGASVGELSISMDATIKLFDGQHRATGIISAVNAEKVPMKGQCVTVQLFVNMSLEARQQAFSDINSNAKAVSASLNMVYDRRNDSVASLAKEIEKVRAWAGKIDHENNIAKSENGMLFSFRHVIQASRIVLGITPKQQPDPILISDVSSWFTSVGHVVYWIGKNVEKMASLMTTAFAKKSEQHCIYHGGFNDTRSLKTIGKAKYGNKVTDHKVSKALELIDWNKSSEMWAGNLVDAKGNMTSGSAGQIAAAQNILDAISPYLEIM